MTSMDVRLAQGAAGDDAWPTSDAAALAQLQAAVANLAQVVEALTGTLAVDTGLTIPLPQTDALTRVQLDASPVDVVGNVVVANPTTTVAVSNLPATQAVSDGGGSLTVDGTVTVANPTTSVTVSNLPATQPVSGTVAVSNHPTPQTDALTNAQLRATAVPVSLATTPGLTDAQLRASYVPVTSPLAVDFTLGRVRAAGSKLSGASGGTGYYCRTTPTGSGKVVTLNDFTLATDNASDVAFRFDTVLASATTLTAFAPNRAVAGSTVAVAATSTAAPTAAGTTLSPIYRLAANIALHQDFPVVLAPGQSVAAVVTVPALGTATAFYVTASWIET